MSAFHLVPTGAHANIQASTHVPSPFSPFQHADDKNTRYAAYTLLARHGSKQHVTAHRINVCKYFADVSYKEQSHKNSVAVLCYRKYKTICCYTDHKLFGLPGNLFLVRNFTMRDVMQK
jgi:hypothetical protein